MTFHLAAYGHKKTRQAEACRVMEILLREDARR